MISRETERSVKENQYSRSKTRSSGKLFENFQGSKESMSHKKRELTASPKETWVVRGIGETRAGFVSIVPYKVSIYTRKTIPRNEKKWITIHADPKLGSNLAILISKTVTTMLRHLDQDERDTGKQLNLHCWESLNEMESKISMTKSGYKRSLKAARREVESELIGYLKLPRNWKNTFTTEDFHGTFSPYWEKDWFQEERRQTQPVKQSSNTNESFWKWPGGRGASWRLHSSTASSLCYELEVWPECSVLGKNVKGAGSRIGILADEVICNHDLRYDTLEIALIVWHLKMEIE